MSQKILVAYFSASGVTERAAKQIAAAVGGDLYEIRPAQPYTDADLDWTNKQSRSTREMKDPACRPAIAGGVADMDAYDTVFVGFPVWWYVEPRIVDTFLESYDLSGKTVVPFCTSHSSGIGSSDTDLHPLAPGAAWKDGRRFGGSESEEVIREWIDGLGLSFNNGNSDVSSFNLEAGVNGNAPTVRLSSGYDMPILGLGTYSLHGDVCKNSIKAALASGFRKFDTASIYGNEEEVGQAMGLTRERVRQIESAAIRKLRSPDFQERLRDYLQVANSLD